MLRRDLVCCFTEQRFTENHTPLSKGSRKKRVLMASGIGTNVSVVPGDPLRIGMLVFYALSFE